MCGRIVSGQPHERQAILCTGGPDVIRKEAWPFYRTISGVRLCWELQEPKGPKWGKPIARYLPRSGPTEMAPT